MAKEIRKEKDWLGREKEVIYEDKEKIGEIREEKTFWGKSVKREYNAGGEQVSETKPEHTWTGKPVDRTYSADTGERLSETRHERTLSGKLVDTTYNDSGELISETRRERTFFGTPVKRVYEKGRPGIETRASTSQSSYSSDAGYSGKRRGSRFGWLAWLRIGIIAAEFVPRILTTFRDENRRYPAPIVEPAPSLEQAKRRIPEVLKSIYQALNKGDPRSAETLISGRLLADLPKLHLQTVHISCSLHRSHRGAPKWRVSGSDARTFRPHR